MSTAAWAEKVRWGSIGRDQGHPAKLGPQSSSASLPPVGPIAPGEDLAPPATASARTGNEARKPAPRPTEAASETPAIRRPVPSYDGREHGKGGGETALWVPRVVLYPLYLVSEYVVRWPVGALTTALEQNRVPARLYDFFTWDDKRAGVVPHGMVDFGLRTSVGAYLFWDDFLTRGNQLRALGATGGRHWWRLDLADRIETAPGQWLILSGAINVRPDWVFHGLGPTSSSGDQSRFRRDLYEGGVGYRVWRWPLSRFESSLTARDVSINPDTGCCGNRNLGDALTAGLFPPPPVLDGYTILRQALLLELDSRTPRLPNTEQIGADFHAAPGTGAKLALRGAHLAGHRKGSVGPNGTEQLEWVTYGATLGGYLDLTGLQRTLGLELIVDCADPLNGHDIPFTELPSLGGYRPLRGFLPGRLVDRSAAAARFSYTWPVWSLFDAVIHYELGNVFGPHLKGFEFPLLRSSYGVGLSASTRRDHTLEILLAFGTRTLRDGAGIEHVRILIGTTTAF